MSILSADTPRCYWDDQDLSCHFREMGGDLYRVVIVAIIVAVIGTPFALACEALICNILAADTIDTTHAHKLNKMRSGVFHASSASVGTELTEGVHKSIIMLKRAEEALGTSAEDDFRSLSKELHMYRISLSDTDKKDFDSK
jgi:hypothetical protein